MASKPSNSVKIPIFLVEAQKLYYNKIMAILSGFKGELHEP